MRISDWSSDVCSSDLTGPVTGFVRKGSGPTSLRLSGLGLLHQGLEGIGLTHRQVRQHLAVELDTSPPDAVHKLGVGQAVLAGAGVDALDPQGAEIALLGAAVAVGVLQALPDPIDGHGEDAVATAPIPLGTLQI